VLLVVFGVLSLRLALAAGVLLVAGHLVVGRRLPWDAGRQASSIAALSQVFAAFVPALLLALGVVALLATLALVALAAVLVAASRRR
jgi:amino acid transporter